MVDERAADISNHIPSHIKSHPIQTNFIINVFSASSHDPRRTNVIQYLFFHHRYDPEHQKQPLNISYPTITIANPIPPIVEEIQSHGIATHIIGSHPSKFHPIPWCGIAWRCIVLHRNASHRLADAIKSHPIRSIPHLSQSHPISWNHNVLPTLSHPTHLNPITSNPSRFPSHPILPRPGIVTTLCPSKTDERAAEHRAIIAY